jgi:hypothetical protein
MRLNDLTGQSYGRWTVVSYAGNKGWVCRCECGTEKRVNADNLKAGKTRSCGCLAIELSRATFMKHGNAKTRHVTPEYRAWQGMKDRCLNPRNIAYDRYGGRGIAIFNGWLNDFPAFHAHVGDRPGEGYSLDRIKVNDGYVPGNVRWATGAEQNRNRRNVGMVGDVDTVTARLASGVSNTTYHRRMRSGWTREDAATTPPRPKRANGLGRVRDMPASRDTNPGSDN